MKKFKIFFSLLLTLALMLQLGAVALAAPDNAAEFKPEAGFSYRCIFDAELLEVAGCKKCYAAGDTADPEIAGFVWRRCGC